MDFDKFALKGKFDIHCDERNAEEKSIFTGDFRERTFTNQYVKSYVGFVEAKGENGDLFVHQKDNDGNEYPAWRVNMQINPKDHDYCGYFVYEGEKYYQTSITVWVSISGILSMYPGGIGRTENGKERRFREETGSKLMNYSCKEYMEIKKERMSSLRWRR